MSINRLFTKEFVAYRYEVVTDIENFKSTQLVEQGSFNGHIQQYNPNPDENLNLNFTVSHRIWTLPTTDVLEGDIINEGENNYAVRAIQRNDFIGDNKHIELLVEKLKEEIEFGS